MKRNIPAIIAVASLLAVGVNPVTLWQPERLLQWENYFNLQSNPLNILALIFLGVVALTLLGIAFLYWVFFSFCLSLGYGELLPPFIAAWAANLIFSSIALVLLLNAE